MHADRRGPARRLRGDQRGEVRQRRDGRAQRAHSADRPRHYGAARAGLEVANRAAEGLLFESAGVARHVEPFLDLADRVRLYNSFLVVRRHCDDTDFHVDWKNANNEAFTLMTPLTDNCRGFGLLYKRLDGSTGEYDYKPGEALIFGDDFIHSTKPGASDERVVLLCFNFGTDKMEHWPRIERTAARQSLLVCRPDGQFQRLPVGQRVRNLVGPILARTGLRRRKAPGSGY